MYILFGSPAWCEICLGVRTDSTPQERQHRNAALLGAAPRVVLAVDRGSELLLKERADAARLASFPTASIISHIILGVRNDHHLPHSAFCVLGEHAQVVWDRPILPATPALLLALLFSPASIIVVPDPVDLFRQVKDTRFDTLHARWRDHSSDRDGPAGRIRGCRRADQLDAGRIMLELCDGGLIEGVEGKDRVGVWADKSPVLCPALVVVRLQAPLRDGQDVPWRPEDSAHVPCPQLMDR